MNRSKTVAPNGSEKKTVHIKSQGYECRSLVTNVDLPRLSETLESNGTKSKIGNHEMGK